MPRTTASKRSLRVADAAVLLLQAYWADEALNENDLDCFHWINEEGLLDAAMLKEIARRVSAQGQQGNDE